MTYALPNAAELARQRLAALEQSYDPASFRRAEALGVGPGWTCLDVGAGGGSVARWLADRVGPSGRVVATDLDVRFLGPPLEVREIDVRTGELEPAAYDLVHTRLVLLHIPEREQVLTRPAGVDSTWARVLPARLDALGLVDVDAEIDTHVPRRLRARALLEPHVAAGASAGRGDGCARCGHRRRPCGARRSRRLVLRAGAGDRLGPPSGLNRRPHGCAPPTANAAPPTTSAHPTPWLSSPIAVAPAITKPSASATRISRRGRGRWDDRRAPGIDGPLSVRRGQRPTRARATTTEFGVRARVGRRRAGRLGATRA
jgi:hypothetical protein